MTARGIALLTGPSGSGKTTLCRDLVAEARRMGREVAGILSPAVFRSGRKIGIDALDLRTGEARPLARRTVSAADAGERWVLDEATLAWGDQVLRAAFPCAVLVVDELGRLEWNEGRGWPSGIAAVDSAAHARALVVVRPALLALARTHWPAAAVIEAGEARAKDHLVSLLT